MIANLFTGKEQTVMWMTMRNPSIDFVKELKFLEHCTSGTVPYACIVAADCTMAHSRDCLCFVCC